MVRLTIAATLLLLQQATAFTLAPLARPDSALFVMKPFQYKDADGIMQEQNGVVPSKPCTPIKTVPSAVSRIKIEKPSDDQCEENHHDLYTVPSAMSKVERGKASDDQSEENHHDVYTVPSAMSSIERAEASDDQSEENHHDVYTVPSAMSSIDQPSSDSSGQESQPLSLPTATKKQRVLQPNRNQRDFNGTTSFKKKSCVFERGQTDPYYE
mmetsp:Transcript_14419/g.36225  ORF Transcript_14419/g.36225 Transcript_14419/m.36225 type:complete len:212 (-) Transcript_14419:84-719(-)